MKKQSGKENNMKGTRKTNDRTKKRLLTLFLTGMLLAPSISPDVRAEEGRTLLNPSWETDSDLEAGKNFTWDCVYFGSYPQSRVKSEDPAYAALAAASGWDEKGDITIGGVRYRRMKKGDSLFPGSSTYRWPDDTTYHYFRYEPIRWRVLSVEEDRALLLSNEALDDQKFHDQDGLSIQAAWDVSTIRSWLNGYGADANEQKKDYRENSFMGDAFSAAEQAAILDSELKNSANTDYYTPGCGDTTDKVFLLMEEELYGTDTSQAYGFHYWDFCSDEARRCRMTAYAAARGVHSSYTHTPKGVRRNCCWWLRTAGASRDMAMNVYDDGSVVTSGRSLEKHTVGVRPAIYLDLSRHTDQWSYAGTVTSADARDLNPVEPFNPYDWGNQNTGNNGDKDSGGTDAGTAGKDPVKVYRITVKGISAKIAAGKKIKLTADIEPFGATDKTVIWKTDNPKIAQVSSRGVVTMKKGSGGKTVTITATAADGSGVKGTYKITSMKKAIKKITVSGKKTVKAGKALKLTAKVTPQKNVNAKLVWSSSNPKYATVNHAGRVKTYKAGKNKTVKITAAAADGSGKKKTVTIRIK